MQMRALAAIAVTLLSGCDLPTTDPVCPTYYEYSADQQEQAAAELEALPAGSVLDVFIGDYGATRAEIRVCRGIE